MAHSKTDIKKYQKLTPEEFAKQCSSIVTLLLKDHKAMRLLMVKIHSSRSSNALIARTYTTLEKLVYSHMAAEELALLNHLKAHPKFEDEALESYEEHRIHEQIFDGIAKLKNTDRALMRMKIYCEILEHHLQEEEEELFPQYKKYFALSTRKKAGRKFFNKRLQTNNTSKRLGALS